MFLHLSYILPFVACAILGFFLSDYFSGRHTGDNIDRSFRFKAGKYIVHLHHWMWSAAVAAVCLAFEIYNPILLGFLLGSIIQGLTYKDWFLIIYKAENFQKIYSDILDK